MQQNYQDKTRLIEELSGTIISQNVILKLISFFFMFWLLFYFLFSDQLDLKNKAIAATDIKHKNEMEEIKAKYKTDMGKFRKEHFFCLSFKKNCYFKLFLFNVRKCT